MNQRMKMSRPFFTCEGGEGSGKTTLIERLRSTLIADGYQTIVAREPGGTPLGERIRDLLLTTKDVSIDPKAECLLFLASRLQQIEEVIKPALQQGKIVLCDRFNDSTIAYQGVARNLGFEKIKNLCDSVCDGFGPTHTFYLDIDPRIGLSRNSQAGKQDRLEQEMLDFHQRVREGFKRISQTDPERFLIIDASQTKDAVFNQVYEHLKSVLCLQS
jgi:dTMP kinase